MLLEHEVPYSVIGTVGGDRPGYDSLVLTDIAQAQDWLGVRNA